MSLHCTACPRRSCNRCFGQDYFPTRAVDDAASVPRIHRAAIHMAAMGLWRPPCGPGGPGPDTVHHDGDCSGCARCPPLSQPEPPVYLVIVEH